MRSIYRLLSCLLILFVLAGCQPVITPHTPSVTASPSVPPFTATRTLLPSVTPTGTQIPTAAATPTIEVFPIPSSTATTLPTPLYRGTQVLNENGVLLRFTTQQDWVILTIDDGLLKGAALDMLDQLKAAGVHATFFLAGKCARDNLGAEVMQRMAAEGHEIAYHSMQHPALEDLQTWTLADWKRDYADWQATLHGLLSDELYAKAVRPFARAPYGLFNTPFLKLCAEFGLLPVSWSCDPMCVDGTLPLPAGRILIYHVRFDQLESLSQLLSLGRQIIPLGEAIK
jgi:hypothetical protein